MSSYLYFVQLNGDERQWNEPELLHSFDDAVRYIKRAQTYVPGRKGRVLRAIVVAMSTDILDNVEEDEDNVPYGGRDDDDEYWEGKA